MIGIGSTLNNRYLLKKKIGEGGFAHVYLATDLELGRQVAIKILDQNWSREADLLNRFRNEARAAAALEHPNILLIYDFGVGEGAPYLVMPYVSGGTLADRMKQGPLTLDEIGVYLEQTGSALDYAHQRGVIHRDVKPSNVLIRSDGQLLLMDFGLAKLLQNAAVVTETGVFGTVGYMAPEQFQGMVGAASDMYMLGVILYQMLAGKLPYEGNTNQVLVGHMHLAPASLAGQPSMRSVHPAVIQALDQVILKVLAKSPADRYPTCQALSYAYYKALKADPHRPAGYYGREKQFDVRDLGGTVIDKPPAAPAAAVQRVEEKKPPLPASPGRGLDATEVAPLPDATALFAIPEAAGAPEQDATQLAPRPPRRKKVLLKPPRLFVTTEPDKGFRGTFDLVGETITMGRAKDNQLCLPLQIISRYHAVLNRISAESQEPTYKIVQLKTVNPLRFNGKGVQEKILEHGDTIEIGKRGYAEYIVKLKYHGAEYGFM